jgi:hypothetical protein
MWIRPEVEVHLKTLGIPYCREESEGHNYENLWQNPAAIDLIPEVKKAAALYDFVKEINSPPSIFQTFGCEKWMNTDFSAPNIPPEFHFHAGSYVDIAFADLEMCRTQKATLELIERFRLRSTKFVDGNTTQVLFEIRNTTNVDWGNWWTLEYWQYGTGRTEQEAEHWWAEGMCFFKAFLLDQRQISRAVPPSER